MRRASWRLSKIPSPSLRYRLTLFPSIRGNISQGEPSSGAAALKRASRKGTVHLSKMTSAVPTCSPKDLCSKRESLSKSPFVRSAFSNELGNSVPTCPAFTLRREKNTPRSGIQRRREYSLSYVTPTPGTGTAPAWRIMPEEVSRLKNLKGDVSRGLNL